MNQSTFGSNSKNLPLWELTELNVIHCWGEGGCSNNTINTNLISIIFNYKTQIDALH